MPGNYYTPPNDFDYGNRGLGRRGPVGQPASAPSRTAPRASSPGASEAMHLGGPGPAAAMWGFPQVREAVGATAPQRAPRPGSMNLSDSMGQSARTGVAMGARFAPGLVGLPGGAAADSMAAVRRQNAAQNAAAPSAPWSFEKNPKARQVFDINRLREDVEGIPGIPKSRHRFDQQPAAPGGPRGFRPPSETEAEETIAPRRLGARDVAAAENPDVNFTPRDIKGDTAGAEAERKSAMSDIEGALFGLRGGLNMRSKREMFTALLGQKNALTGQAYDMQNKRDMTGAALLQKGAESQADYNEAGSKRRDAASVFNSEMNVGVDKYNIDRDDKIEAANTPMARRMAELELMAAEQGIQKGDQGLRKGEVDIASADAAAAREADLSQLGRDAKSEEAAFEFRDRWRAANPNASPTEELLAVTEYSNSREGEVSPSERLAHKDIERGVIADVSNKGTGWWDDMLSGVYRNPFQSKEMPNIDENTVGQLNINEAPGFLGTINRWTGNPLYDVTLGDHDDSYAPRQRVDKKERDRLQRLQGGAKRKSQDLRYKGDDE